MYPALGAPVTGRCVARPFWRDPSLNLILFTSEEAAHPLPRTDPRARHILEVLQRQPGDPFDAGLRNGPRGKGRIIATTETALTLDFEWGPPPPPLEPLTLIIGLPRPQTARKILREATSLGVAALHFVITDRSDPGYAHSTLWSGGEWERQLIAGAEQAFCTHLPAVTWDRTLAATLAALPTAGPRLALDNYEAPLPLSRFPSARDTSVILAFGAERGWSADERTQLKAARFDFTHLGSRVLRLETAVVAAVALIRAKQGTM